MLDQSTLIKIARLRTLAARQGKAFDVVLFVSDRTFAKNTLVTVLESDDEATVLLGLELMQALGMVALDTRSVPVKPAATPVPEPSVPSLPPGRYIGRLR